MAKEPLKVVVRLLPPEITEEELLATINKTHIQRTKWRSFVPGKRYKGEAKPSLNARCYFKFDEGEAAEEFVKDYHGHQFVDGQGEHFRAVVCFAPYQKAPRSKPQKDPRDGTILDDPVYKEFLETLADASKKVYEAPPDPKVLLKPLDYGDTPLLKFMQTRAKERRARAEKKARRWREMETIQEDPKKAKWRCAECGTSKHLEEDPDSRGTFYCTYCWESWETHEAPAPKFKKKKKSKEAEEGEAEETEKVIAKKKKKKKDKDYEDEEEAAPKSEWRPKDKTGYGAEADDTEKRRRRKKEREKEREAGAAEEEDDRGKSTRWRVKRSEAADESYEQDWDRDRHRGKAKGSHRSSQDDWWEDDRSGKRSDWRSDKPEKAASSEDARGSRWRAKASSTPAAEDGAGEAEEKTRRRHKDKKGDGGETYWRPKS